jgi:hypothetical protein
VGVSTCKKNSASISLINVCLFIAPTIAFFAIFREDFPLRLVKTGLKNEEHIKEIITTCIGVLKKLKKPGQSRGYFFGERHVFNPVC